jgi:S1-C subfamily serine protease
LPDLIDRTLPSVVTISSVRLLGKSSAHTVSQISSTPVSERGGSSRVAVQHAVGSGVVLEANTIVTNRHVVANADRITVTVAGGRSLSADIVGSDADTDLAVLRLNGGAEQLVPLKWGDSDQLRVGEAVVAIGNPFGLGESVALGIVSGKGRSHLGMMNHESFIQVDAAINPGDSGGALINARGELVGISTAMVTSRVMSTRIGFAIPSNLARSVIDGLLVPSTARDSTTRAED